jgi:hypothetical protein
MASAAANTRSEEAAVPPLTAMVPRRPVRVRVQRATSSLRSAAGADHLAQTWVKPNGERRSVERCTVSFRIIASRLT